MSVPKKASAPADKVEFYEKLVATNPDVEQKGATHPYTSLNGNMFSYLHPSGSMALRLPQEEREKFLKKYQTTLFMTYGIVQKEYVTVPDTLLKNTRELRKYFELSYRYAQSLKPKPTKKPPKKK
jgi:TfoX/Sxy family transcriptional regulator of competence genes